MRSGGAWRNGYIRERSGVRSHFQPELSRRRTYVRARRGINMRMYSANLLI